MGGYGRRDIALCGGARMVDDDGEGGGVEGTCAIVVWVGNETVMAWWRVWVFRLEGGEVMRYGAADCRMDEDIVNL